MVLFLQTATGALSDGHIAGGIVGVGSMGAIYLCKYAIDRLAERKNNGNGNNGKISLGKILSNQSHALANLLEIRQDQDTYNSEMISIMRDIHQSIKDNGVLIAQSKEYKG